MNYSCLPVPTDTLSRITESNCPLNLGKVAYYRYTNPAIVGEIGLEPIRTMYTSSHTHKNLTLLYVTFPQVTVFALLARLPFRHSPITVSKNCCKFMKNISYLQIYFILDVVFFKRVLNRVPRIPFRNFTAAKRRCYTK